MLKVPSHFSFRPHSHAMGIAWVMIKRRGGNWIENLTLDHKSFKKKGQIRFNQGTLYIIGKIFLRVIRHCPCIFKINVIWKRYECPKFWDNKTPTWESWGKVTNVVPIEKHKIYYRKGGGASSKGWRLWKACVWGYPY
jgi:hypothetical protein